MLFIGQSSASASTLVQQFSPVPLRSLLFIIVLPCRFLCSWVGFFSHHNSEQQMCVVTFSFLVNWSALNILLRKCVHWFRFYSFMDGLFLLCIRSRIFADIPVQNTHCLWNHERNDRKARYKADMGLKAPIGPG